MRRANDIQVRIHVYLTGMLVPSGGVLVEIRPESAEKHKQPSVEEADGECEGNHHDEG